MHNTVPLNDYYENALSMDLFLNSGNTNRKEVEKAYKMLEDAIETLLTDKQKRCVKMYYFQHKSMREIAKILGVNPSTVTRTIQSAKKRLSILSFFLDL